MSKKKLTDISKIKDEKVVLTNQLANLKNHPEINFAKFMKNVATRSLNLT